ncbi:MAG: Holliday junction resolvase RuvX [Patescibacteria group bacterium]|nr:Holliday junction resolvase RuvX [Patescibacteria group bacterium]
MNINNKTQYILGIDWGMKKCGIAIADDETRIATAKKECGATTLFELVDSINKRYPLSAIIIGSSKLNVNDRNLKHIKKVIEQFTKNGFSVHEEEEMFSTLLAQRNLAEADKKNISKNDNAESARVILQSWLDNNRRT